MKQNDNKLEATQKIHKKILEVYPFLTKEEKDTFIKSAEKVISKDKEIEETVRRLLELLNNPHADIKEWHKPDKEFMKRVKPERLPSFVIQDRILTIKIPSWLMWLGSIDKKLISFCQKNVDKYDSIIIDVRENHGGNSVYAHNFAGIFFKKSFSFGKVIKKDNKGKLKTIITKLTPNKDVFIDKPIVILISRKCFSSNELFLAPFKISKRATLIGQKTAGGSANPISEIVEISGKRFVVRIPTHRFFLKGNKQPIEKTKIKPDIPYNGNIEEFAKDYLIKQIGVK